MTAPADIAWGPSGELVYQRTYSRTKADGSKETWPETVRRTVDGNLALVAEPHLLPGEREDLIAMITDFKLLPAGRHLFASGVKGATHLMNCWHSGWTDRPSDHFEFSFMRLMEMGGVGTNYSNKYLAHYPAVAHELSVEIVCDPEHPDFAAMRDAGLISSIYDADWTGAFPVEDSREGWAAALVDLIDTFYRPDVEHYHRVYDVSRVREMGSRLRTTGGTASGPLPLAQMLTGVAEVLSSRAGHHLTGIDAMEIDHAVAQCVVAGGVRRSARMSIMHWNDPQIDRFMTIKADTGSHWTTNISVEVDDDFWSFLNEENETAWFDQALKDKARTVLRALAEGAVLNGEPGFWDSSLSNVGEPNPVSCTNPCGEIALQAWEPCNLGHINLAGFVNAEGEWSSHEVARAHELMTRFLIRATFAPVSDPKSREVLDRNRRIGVGHFGVASFLAMTGLRYSEAPSDTGFRAFLDGLADTVADAAIAYAHALRIPVPVKTRTVAPTGTIAKLPGVSEGIHPIFAKYFTRRIRFSNVDAAQMETVEDYRAQGYLIEDDLYAENTTVVAIPTKDTLVDQAVAIHGPAGEDFVEAADDLTLEQMLAFQALYQEHWADNAVSYTANVDPVQYSPADVAKQIVLVGGKVKGATIFPEASMPQSPYTRMTRAEYESSRIQAVADSVDENCATGACPIR